MRSLLLFPALALASPLLHRRTTLAECLAGASLDPVTSSSSSYSSDTTAYNTRLTFDPAALVVPSSPDDIAAALRCAEQQGVAVSARGGGHSYAALGLGGQDGSLVIDLSKFSGINYGQDGAGTALVGGGVRLGDLALALNDQGQGTAHGTCPFVGIGGHAGLGGYGFTSRTWGLTLDNVYAYDVVLANSTILKRVTFDTVPDLVWALNGAAPNFAIVTSYYIRTHTVPSVVTSFSYSYGQNSISLDQAVSFFQSYQSYSLTSAPAQLGVSMTFGAYGSVTLAGTYAGSQVDFEAAMGSLIASMPAGYASDVKEQSWIQSLEGLAGSQALSTKGVANTPDAFFVKSLMTPEDSPMSYDAIHAFISYLFYTGTDTAWFVQVDLYGGAGSAINAVVPGKSSFGHRNKLLNFQMYASSSNHLPPYPAAGLTFVQGIYDSILNSMSTTWNGSEGAYINYVDPSLSRADAERLYWGADHYARLSAFKGVWDPTNLFRNPTSVLQI